MTFFKYLWPLVVCAALLGCGPSKPKYTFTKEERQPAQAAGEKRKRVEPPEDFEQMLARGQIPAIDAPKYVSASEAEIPDEDFVLGVLVEGQPIAYSLNLMNNHEVVNDCVADKNFAVVW